MLCTAYDPEPVRNLFCTDPNDPSSDAEMAKDGEEVAREQNRLVEEFDAGADLLIHDTQYTEQEYHNNKIGWGHSTYEYAIEAANRAGVKQMALFHHDPLRTDQQMDDYESIYCNNGPDTKVFFAKEGMEIIL